MSKTVSVSIINWNGIDYFPRCLNSIDEQDYQGEIEIIIVDNFSTDGSLEYLEGLKNGIKILKNKNNKGFSYAHNQAIRASNGEYILLLNFDVFLDKNFISEMVKCMDTNLKIGIISGKLYKQIDSKKSKILDSTGITMKYCFMHPRGAMEEDVGQYDNPKNLTVFGACGAAPFYRRAMLEDIKCFDEFLDEDFVSYVEDVDLSWRTQLNGWECMYNPKAIAYHERGATRKNNHSMQRDYLVYGFRNRYWSMVKNITPTYWKKNKFKIIGRELLFQLGSIKNISRITRLKALYLALKNLRKMLAKRRIIQKNKLVLDDHIDSFLCYNNLNLHKMMLTTLSLEIENIKSKLRNNKHGTNG